MQDACHTICLRCGVIFGCAAEAYCCCAHPGHVRWAIFDGDVSRVREAKERHARTVNEGSIARVEKVACANDVLSKIQDGSGP
jgi:hypothetical protein